MTSKQIRHIVLQSNGLPAFRRAATHFEPGARPLQCHFRTRLRSVGDGLAISTAYAPAALSAPSLMGLDFAPLVPLGNIWQCRRSGVPTSPHEYKAHPSLKPPP